MSDAVARVARDAVADAHAVLAGWAAQPSGSHDAEGLACMARLVTARAATLPARAERVPLGPGNPSALRLVCRPEAARRVLLVGHMDTVHGPHFPGPAIARTDDLLTGPGVADMKGGILVMLAALAGLEASHAAPVLGWEVLLTPDEELGAPLTRGLLTEAAGRAEAGLVFEPAPAGGGVVVSRRGRVVLRLTVTGRAAHAGRNPADGRNAVTALAELLLAAETCAEPARGVDVTVGLARGGTAVNVVPDHAEAQVDVRADHPGALQGVRRRIAAAADEIGARRDVRFAVEELVGCPPMTSTPASLALAHAYDEGLATLGGEAQPVGVGGVSDANHLAGTGLPVLDGLGPEGGDLHGPGEWVSLASIPQRAAAAALLLARLAAGPVE
ncbi:MAG: M20/M25/M40 family metallo-hydrolase [Thermoleophilia bacterium]